MTDAKFTEEEFNLVIVGLVKGYKQAYDLASNDFTAHMLAVECLDEAIGPGVDPKKVAEFAKKVEQWVTLPVVGFVPLVLRAGGTALMDKIAGSKTPSILGEIVNEARGKNKKIGQGLVNVKVPKNKSLLARSGLANMRKGALPRVRGMGMKTVPMGRVFDPTGALNWGFKILAEMGPLLGALQMRGAALYALDSKVVPRRWNTHVGQILAKARQPQQLKAAVSTANDQLDATWTQLQMATAEMEFHRQQLKLPPVSL